MFIQKKITNLRGLGQVQKKTITEWHKTEHEIGSQGSSFTFLSSGLAAL